MGCGGSKEEVATENAVTTRRLLRKKSNATSIKTTTASSGTTQGSGADPIGNGSNPIPDKVGTSQGSEPPPPAAEAKDATPSTDVKANKEEKLISKDSPDRYFSSRKDEDAAAAVTRRVGSEGVEYYSTPFEPKSEKIEADDGLEGSRETGLIPAATEVGEGDAVKEETGLVSEGGAENAPKGEEGKPKGNDSADSKEAILVEEEGLKETNVEKKNVGEGEIGNGSLPQ